MNECDFCSEPIGEGAFVYPAADITDNDLSIIYKGSWAACITCAAFIRQFDSGKDTRAKDNLARRAIEKYRRKYGLHGVGIPDKTLNAVLMIEVRALHDKFWESRQGEPVPYEIKALEG